MGVSEAKRLKALEHENNKLKHIARLNAPRRQPKENQLCVCFNVIKRCILDPEPADFLHKEIRLDPAQLASPANVGSYDPDVSVDQNTLSSLRALTSRAHESFFQFNRKPV